MKKIIITLVSATACVILLSCTNSATQSDNSVDSLSLAEDSLALLEDSLQQTTDEAMPASKEIEALVLHFERDYQKANNIYGYRTHNKYIVTLRMNGDADIHEEETMTSKQTAEIPENERQTDVYDTMGVWVLREIKRGAGYIEYYSIEFNDDMNWCVDNECKYLYFTREAYETRNQKYANKILKVDTLFVE